MRTGLPARTDLPSSVIRKMPQPVDSMSPARLKWDFAQGDPVREDLLFPARKELQPFLFGQLELCGQPFGRLRIRVLLAITEKAEERQHQGLKVWDRHFAQSNHGPPFWATRLDFHLIDHQRVSGGGIWTERNWHLCPWRNESLALVIAQDNVAST